MTIYYTTIDGHAPSLPPPSARRGRRGRPGRDGITTRGRRRGRWDALDAPGSPTSASRRSGRNAIDMLDHSYQRQHGTGTPSGVFKSYIFPSGFFYKNTNRRAGSPPWAASGI
nr:MAG TPA: hypothetical protein [Caudoviricetes sp.]